MDDDIVTGDINDDGGDENKCNDVGDNIDDGDCSDCDINSGDDGDSDDDIVMRWMEVIRVLY